MRRSCCDDGDCDDRENEIASDEKDDERNGEKNGETNDEIDDCFVSVSVKENDSWSDAMNDDERTAIETTSILTRSNHCLSCSLSTMTWKTRQK